MKEELRRLYDTKRRFGLGMVRRRSLSEPAQAWESRTCTKLRSTGLSESGSLVVLRVVEFSNGRLNTPHIGRCRVSCDVHAARFKGSYRQLQTPLELLWAAAKSAPCWA